MTNANRGDSGDPFPSGATILFDDSSNPSAGLYDGSPSGLRMQLLTAGYLPEIEVAFGTQICRSFDADRSGYIDGFDLSRLGIEFGGCAASSAAWTWSRVDFNHDGCVNGEDLAILGASGVGKVDCRLFLWGGLNSSRHHSYQRLGDRLR